MNRVYYSETSDISMFILCFWVNWQKQFNEELITAQQDPVYELIYAESPVTIPHGLSISQKLKKENCGIQCLHLPHGPFA